MREPPMDKARRLVPMRDHVPDLLREVGIASPLENLGVLSCRGEKLGQPRNYIARGHPPPVAVVKQAQRRYVQFPLGDARCLSPGVARTGGYLGEQFHGLKLPWSKAGHVADSRFKKVLPLRHVYVKAEQEPERINSSRVQRVRERTVLIVGGHSGDLQG